MWKPTKILTYSTKDKEWTKTEFNTFKEWRDFILSQWKWPGEYNFHTDVWCEAAHKFTKTGRYCDFHPNSKEYKNFWLLERRKCEQGIIVDGIYISPDIYFFWNYCRIPNKLKEEETFPDPWDGHYHLDLYYLLAELHGEDGAGTKSRQKGISLYQMARITRRLWFGKKFMLKVVSEEEEYVLGEWGIMQTYRNHLNNHTGWYRTFTPDESLNWEQKRQVTEGTVNKKAIYKGNFSKVKGLTTKMNVTKAVGGCMIKGEQVYTTEGLKNIEDIKIGDYVFGIDGQQKKIIQLFTGIDDIYKVKQKYGEDYYVNSQHKLVLFTENKRFKNQIITPTVNEWLELSKIKRFERSYSGIKINKPLCFNQQNIKIDPYLLGLWLGDGYSGRPTIIINNSDDPEILSYIRNKDWNQDITISRKEEKRYNKEMYTVHFKNSSGAKKDNWFFNFLRDYNLIDNKHIPKEYLYNDLSIRLELLAGIIDTDGTYIKEKNEYEISSSNKHFLEEIKILCTTLGMYSTIRTVKSKSHSIKNKIIKETEYYILRIYTAKDLIIPCKVKRKKGVIRNREANRTPISIEYYGKETYYGFECEDHLYVLKDGTITHNSAKEIYVTEAGINKKLLKIKEFVDPNMKMGNVKTGMFIAIGATGELKDAEGLMELCFNPKAHNIRPIKDVFTGSDNDIGFFFPEEWNYTHQDDDTGEIIVCYDKYGNSNVELAVKLIEQEDAKQKNKKDPASYRLWKSQHPRTMQDAFDQREDNPFPTDKLKEQEFLLIPKKPIIVELTRDINGKIIHKFSNDVPVSKLKPNPLEDNRGAIIIDEFPIDKPPFGLYYAGVDPIFDIDTQTSRSLMAIRIWIGTHERDGKIVEPYPVAYYTGRHKDAKKTYQICCDLIEWYNARTAVECNVKDFIEWMIKENKSRYLMRRRELTVINELTPNSTINDEIGVRMEGKFKDRCLEKYITWLNTHIGTKFNLETGDSQEVYNTSKVNDPMLIKEMLRFDFKKNTDRIVADMLALIAAQTDTNRHIITSMKNPFEQQPKKTISKLPSSFKAPQRNSLTKLSSPFAKR